MNFKALFLIITLFMGWPQPAECTDLFEAKKILCRYCSGTSVDWYLQEPKPLIVKSEYVEQICPNVVFDSIDRVAKTATAVEGGNQTAAEVWESSGGVTFTELSYSVSLVMTTVFIKQAQKEKMYLSVRSDHSHRRDFPVPTQFYGACELLE
jgi:hypothetical protein